MQLRPIYKKLLLASVSLLLLLIVSGAFWLNHEVKQPYAHQAKEKIITISAKASTKAIVAQLHREGVLAKEWPAVWWLRLSLRAPVSSAGVVPRRRHRSGGHRRHSAAHR